MQEVLKFASIFIKVCNAVPVNSTFNKIQTFLQWLCDSTPSLVAYFPRRFRKPKSFEFWPKF